MELESVKKSVVEECLITCTTDTTQYKPITVEKDINVTLDVGNLLLIDPNVLEFQTYRLVTVSVSIFHRTLLGYYAEGMYANC